MSGATIIISPASGIPVQGLIFPSNETVGSDIGIDWTGSAMLPRFQHTALWKCILVDQLGYYAFAWHCLDDDSWGGGTSKWEYGTHPHPSDGTVDGNGYAIGGTGSSGAVHYHEIANGSDKISNGGAPLQVVKGVELWQMRTCEQVASDYVHRFYPDLQGNPSFYIEWIEAVVSVSADPGVKFRKGCSPWRKDIPSSGRNDETPSGTYWQFMQYTTVKTVPQALVKLAMTTNDTSDPNVHYSNISPTPTDITDKSGKGNHPSWANANRPSLYSP